MADRVNLNKARKARERARQKAEADQNALRFGRTKAEKQREAAEAEKARAHLDQHLRDRE